MYYYNLRVHDGKVVAQVESHVPYSDVNFWSIAYDRHPDLLQTLAHHWSVKVQELIHFNATRNDAQMADYISQNW